MSNLEKQKGFSLPSVIIGSLIVSVLGAVAISSMWSSVDSSKVTTLKSIIKEQVTVFESEPNYDYDSINTDGNQDYLPELVEVGILTPIPKVFREPDKLTWEIRKIVIDGYKNVFYATISSTNPDDQEIIDKAVTGLSLNPSRILVN